MSLPFANNGEASPSPRRGDGNGDRHRNRYTQGSDLINAPSAPRPDPPSSIESSYYPQYQPEPSFMAPPIPYPSPRLPNGSLPSLPGSQHTFFPNFPRYTNGGTPLVNVTALNNTNGEFSHPPITGVVGTGEPLLGSMGGTSQRANGDNMQPGTAPMTQQPNMQQAHAGVPFGYFQTFAREVQSLPSAPTFDFSSNAPTYAPTFDLSALPTSAPLEDPFQRRDVARTPGPNGSHASQLSQHSRQSSIATQEAFQQAFLTARQSAHTSPQQQQQRQAATQIVPAAQAPVASVRSSIDSPVAPMEAYFTADPEDSLLPEASHDFQIDQGFPQDVYSNSSDIAPSLTSRASSNTSKSSAFGDLDQWDEVW